MNFIKKYFKILIGAGVLLIALAVFVSFTGSKDLANGTLKDWPRAALEDRMTTMQMLVGTDDNTELLVQCVDKMATLPESAEMAIADAARLCNLGVLLKENQ